MKGQGGLSQRELYYLLTGTGDTGSARQIGMVNNYVPVE